MYTKTLLNLIHGTPLYDKKTPTNLSKIIKKYPYFQTAHLLHTLRFLHMEDAHFLADMRKTAVYLNDRRKLFFLIENRFFDIDKIEALQHEIPKDTDSVFNLIDSFLSEKEKTLEKPEEIRNFPTILTDYTSVYLSEIPEEKAENVTPLQFQDVIDRFFAQDKISPIKLELNGQDGMEKASIPNVEQAEDNVFFSETISKFYIKQRKYDKALEIIRKIVLLYPEKSSYFAVQIQLLEDLVSMNKNKTE
ncbi:MAG: hypothetical protein LBE71_01725 [Dysgonamonadaceae bacterium]|jgi:hypothetical protein|nr:hypothetical protein [Dysgonamonadaceae bacterium]